MLEIARVVNGYERREIGMVTNSGYEQCVCIEGMVSMAVDEGYCTT